MDHFSFHLLDFTEERLLKAIKSAFRLIHIPKPSSSVNLLLPHISSLYAKTAAGSPVTVEKLCKIYPAKHKEPPQRAEMSGDRNERVTRAKGREKPWSVC